MLDLFAKSRLSTKWRFLVGATFALLFIGFTVNMLFSRLSLNLAHVVLNKTLWQGNQSAEERQQMISLAADLLEVSVGRQTLGREYEKPYTMISAITIAEYHRRQNELSEIVTWLRRAADAEPCPSIQEAVVLPNWVKIDSFGNIIVGWNRSHWYFRHDSQPASLVFDPDHERFALSYENTLGKRDKVIYAWKGPLQIHYWHTLQLRVKVEKGTFLTVGTHFASGTKKQIDYYHGTGLWETFIIPLDEDVLRFIYISTSEPSPDLSVPEYRIEVEPLTFLLDDAIGACER